MGGLVFLALIAVLVLREEQSFKWQSGCYYLFINGAGLSFSFFLRLGLNDYTNKYILIDLLSYWTTTRGMQHNTMAL